MFSACRHEWNHPRLRARGNTGKICFSVAGLMCSVTAMALAAQPTTPAPPLYACRFAKGEWKTEEWTLIKSPRWDRVGQWIQREDCIENETPADATPQEKQGKRTPETYTSMVYKNPVSGDLKATCTMLFEHEMAPLIVLASELGVDGNGRREYREHYEIVLFNQGVNLWHHRYTDGKPSWVLAAFGRFELHKSTKYVLEVRKRGKQITVVVDGHTFGYREETLPDKIYVGITGCEGVNRFYDFSIGTGAE